MPLALGAGSAGGLGGPGGVVLTNSADFEESSNEHFTRAYSAGDSRRIWSLSVWLKREEVTTDLATIFIARDDSSQADRSGVLFKSDDTLRFETINGGFYRNVSTTAYAQTDWHHWFFVHDTTNGTAANRLRIWRDGIDIAETTESSGNPPLNYDGWVGTANDHYIGRANDGNTRQFDGKMADLHYIDGLAQSVGDFVTWDGSNFTILNYAGSYGTNGCRLRFDNAGDLGEDSSGNSNDWTNVNTVTQSTDVPTSPI